MTNPSVAQVFKNPRLLLAFGFGSGLSPIIPGTMGTLVSVPLYLMFALLPLGVYASLVILSAGFGIYLCGYASKTLGVHDHKGIVWDEFVGYWISMFALPLNWKIIVIGFFVFRFFDMVKPWPICLADRNIHGGFGIMFDDILAGFATCGVLHLLLLGGWL